MHTPPPRTPCTRSLTPDFDQHWGPHKSCSGGDTARAPGSRVCALPGCLIEAPWLVNGGHGASLKHRPRPPARVPCLPRPGVSVSWLRRRLAAAAPPPVCAHQVYSCTEERIALDEVPAAGLCGSMEDAMRAVGGEPNGGTACFNDAPCPPFTSHGASIRQLFGAGAVQGEGGGGGGAAAAASAAAALQDDGQRLL
jgi:hypothetical protein